MYLYTWQNKHLSYSGDYELSACDHQEGLDMKQVTV